MRLNLVNGSRWSPEIGVCLDVEHWVLAGICTGVHDELGRVLPVVLRLWLTRAGIHFFFPIM